MLIPQQGIRIGAWKIQIGIDGYVALHLIDDNELTIVFFVNPDKTEELLRDLAYLLARIKVV